MKNAPAPRVLTLTRWYGDAKGNSFEIVTYNYSYI